MGKIYKIIFLFLLSLKSFGQVAPLCQTQWNQEPYYNALCPFNQSENLRCVTGCVATAMAQIMKRWNYPNHGTGSYSYNDTTTSGFSYDYGIQSANFGATTYLWSQMPNSVTSIDTPVAILMYQCAVSVAMDFGTDDQGGSGAWVFQSQSGGIDNPCAQQAYVLYFGYNPNTLQALTQSNFSDSAWIAIVKNELNNGRPIEYQGWDIGAGGHTWVCDGYDQDTLFHMNWGWGGHDNGYFDLTNLDPNPFHFTSNNGALIGIEPLCQDTTFLTASSCDNYEFKEWEGITTTSGLFYHTFAGNCDSTICINVTINPSYDHLYYDTACNYFQLAWDSTVTVSGEYCHLFNSVEGCDSSVCDRVTINCDKNLLKLEPRVSNEGKEVTVKYEGVFSVSVYDLTGRLVEEKEGNGEVNILEASGVYILRIRANNNMATKIIDL